MEYHRLGQCGLKVSEICLGTMTFGHGTDAFEAERMVGAALDAGVNFLDTADGYSDGESETMLGRALGARRGDVVIATKVFNPMGPGPNDSGMSRMHIMRAVEDSLRRLGTDYIDLYFIHHVDTQTPLEEMLRAFDDLVRQGKVRYTGCSNYEAWRLMEAIWVSDSKGLARFAAYQPQYSLVVRDIEDELVPACELKGIGIVAWSPLAGGYLSGKYRPGQLNLQGARSAEQWAFPKQFFHPGHEAILTELHAVAGALGESAARVAIRWALEQKMVASAIVGARNMEQLRGTLAAGGWRLPQEMRARLDKVSAPPRRYPRAMEEGMAARRDSAVRMPQGASRTRET
ncbi:MAG: aldo/keto reductase [Alphaproteobacteria bacterium]|nr:aldo/keto reductase [Alphaproteobacteria bacterium]